MFARKVKSRNFIFHAPSGLVLPTSIPPPFTALIWRSGPMIRTVLRPAFRLLQSALTPLVQHLVRITRYIRDDPDPVASQSRPS